MSDIESEIVLPRVNLHGYANMAVVDIDSPINNSPVSNGKIKTKDPEEIVKIARRTFNSGKTRDLNFRKQQLKNFLKMCEENEDAMVEALTKDLHKHKLESSAYEITLIKSEIYNILINFNEWLKPENPSKPLLNFFDKVQIYKDPYGVVLVLGAWNYPLQLTLIPVAGAIAGGNCVIIKPSEIAKHTAKFIEETIPKYLDKSSYHVLVGGVPETTTLLEQKFDYIFFTGSPNVGKIVYKAASNHLTPCTLELGGKSPVYIDNTADIDLATRRILWGKCINAGQTCIAPDYILCSKEIETKLLQCAQKYLRQFYGDDMKSSPYLPRIITDRHFNRLVGFLKYNNIAFGGDYNASDRYIQPTILNDVKPNDIVMQEEIFGPILPIMTIHSVHEFIDFVNAREKPLAMYLFSKNKKDVELILGNTSAGGVTVNDSLMHAAVETLPFGGVGNSGMGSYHGKKTFETFVHKKSVLKKNFLSILEKMQFMRYPPYTDLKVTLINAFVTKRKGISTKHLPYIFSFILGVIITVIFQKIFTNGH